MAETERLKVEAALGIARRIPLNTFDQLAADTLRLHILEPRLVDFAWAHFRERQRAGLPLVGTPIDTSRGFRRPPAGPSHALYAEHYVAARLGGSVTQFSGDRGIDVLAPGWAVQVKNTTSPAGRPVVQNIYGAAATFGKPAVWSNSGFTKSAEEEARRLGVTLWNF